MKNSGVGLRTKIILSLIILMIAAVALIGIVVLKVSERNLLEQKIKAGKNLMESVVNSTNILYHDNPDAFPDGRGPQKLQKIIDLFTRKNIFHELFFVNKNFKIIAHQSPGLIGEEFRDKGLNYSLSPRNKDEKFAEGKISHLLRGGYLLVYAPIEMGNELVGAVRGRISLDGVKKTLAKAHRIIVFYIFFDSLLLILLGSFLLSRLIIKPIKKLIKVTEKLAEGDFSERLDHAGRNEIGILSSSFNRMSGKLEENKKKLEDYVISLEKMNQELRAAQQEVIRIEKLASVGKLAAGVAHEVGNPIGAILGYTHILEKGVDNKEEEKDYLKRIEHESIRIDTIIRDLLDFSRPSEVKVEEIDISKIADNTISLLSPQKILSNIKVNLELGKGIPLVPANENQLQQVMINLIINASDAMPDGGSLVIQTSQTKTQRGTNMDGFGLVSRRKDDPGNSDYSHLRKNYNTAASMFQGAKKSAKYAIIKVTDTGAGIKKEDISRIFDPFFTTKEPGKGTGLGLSVCSRIIDSFGGKITVESQEGKGTTFSVILPAKPDLY